MKYQRNEENHDRREPIPERRDIEHRLVVIGARHDVRRQQWSHWGWEGSKWNSSGNKGRRSTNAFRTSCTIRVKLHLAYRHSSQTGRFRKATRKRQDSATFTVDKSVISFAIIALIEILSLLKNHLNRNFSGYENCD